MSFLKSLLHTVWLLVLCTGLSCSTGSGKEPENLIDEDKMVKVLTDVHLAEAKISKLGLRTSDSSTIVYKRLERDIFRKWAVDTAAYTQSYIYYSSDPEKLTRIYEQVTKNLQQPTKPIKKPI